MDQNRVTPSFRTNSDIILGLIFPSYFWNVKYPVWDKDDINKSITQLEEYYAVARVSSARLPPGAALGCPSAGKQYCLRHNYSTTDDDPWIQIELDTQWLTVAQEPWIIFLENPYWTEIAARMATVADWKLPASAYAPAIVPLFIERFFSLIFIHRLSWLINLLVGVVGDGQEMRKHIFRKKVFLILWLFRKILVIFRKF